MKIKKNDYPTINEDSLKKINELVLQNSRGILLSGPSCIGKTYFSGFLKHQDGFVGGVDFPKLPMRWVYMSETASEIHQIAVNTISNQRNKHQLGCCGRDGRDPAIIKRSGEKIDNKLMKMREHGNIIKHKGIIVLGVPWYIWKERNFLRDRHPDWTRSKSGPGKFKERYARYLNKLEEYNLPHICIDNRNDCPILDNSTFLTMLTDEN